jgi:hypothetical protein
MQFVFEERLPKGFLNFPLTSVSGLPSVKADRTNDLIDVVNNSLDHNRRVPVLRLLEQRREGCLAAVELLFNGRLAFDFHDKLLTGKPPKVERAIRFAPMAMQDGLAPINIAGNPAYSVEPGSQNFYARVIDLRRAVKAQFKQAQKAGAPPSEIDRLDAEQLALKILANATSYGIFIELNVEDAEKGSPPITAYGVDGAFTTNPSHRETPGSHFHPLLATLITGAARLMLAITERLLIDEGLDWAFCDTDSMAFAKPAAMPNAEFRQRVERVCAWFEALNPYEKKGSILEFEDQNADPVTGEPRDLFCYAISAKRYALFNWGDDGLPVIRKASAHGLGHLMPPYGDDDPDAPPRTSGVHLWQEHLWKELILASARGDDDDAGLQWRVDLERPAASRYAATTPAVLSWFKTFNRDLPYEEKVRPFNFLLWFHAKKPHDLAGEDELALFGPRQRRPKPVAPYQRDLSKIEQRWDRDTGDLVGPEWLRTYAEVLRTYPVHSESKFLDGVRSQCGPTRRRHVKANLVWNIGKEADRFEEDAAIGADDDPSVPYALSLEDRAAAINTIRAAKAKFSVRELRKAAGVSDLTIAMTLEPDSAVDDERVLRIVRGIGQLEARATREAAEDEELLAALRVRAEKVGAGAVAAELGVDPSNLAKVISGSRGMSSALRISVRSELTSHS